MVLSLFTIQDLSTPQVNNLLTILLWCVCLRKFKRKYFWSFMWRILVENHLTWQVGYDCYLQRVLINMYFCNSGTSIKEHNSNKNDTSEANSSGQKVNKKVAPKRKQVGEVWKVSPKVGFVFVCLLEWFVILSVHLWLHHSNAMRIQWFWIFFIQIKV